MPASMLETDYMVLPGISAAYLCIFGMLYPVFKSIFGWLGKKSRELVDVRRRMHVAHASMVRANKIYDM